MGVRKKDGALTAEEKPIVKALFARKWRNQDIQDLVNRGRKATINSARITEVKQSGRVKAASDDETDFFIAKKKAWDSRTGLNLFDDERLLRAREAISWPSTFSTIRPRTSRPKCLRSSRTSPGRI